MVTKYSLDKKNYNYVATLNLMLVNGDSSKEDSGMGFMSSF